MARSSRTPVATATRVGLVALLAGLAACGHFSVELLPGIDEGDAGGQADGDVDASISDDGAIDASLDARDAGCVGPDCPGTYVSASVGEDTNPGTGAKPVKTIGRAIEIAKTLGGAQKVFIAGGGGQKYGEKVTLVEGVSLLGGYDCSSQPCSWTRDVLKNVTTIDNQDFEGVLADKSITRATLVEGLAINGKSGVATAFPGSAGVTLVNGSPIIRACRVQAGDVTSSTIGAKRSIGIAVLGAPTDAKGALIDLSTIRAGQSNDYSVAIYIDRVTSAVPTAAVGVTIRKNVIKGGQGAASAGILAFPGSPSLIIASNSIDAGNATVADGPGAWGIVFTGAGTITQNKINLEGNGPTCLPSPGFCGGIHSQSATAIVTSNVIRGAKADHSAAIMLAEGEGQVAPLAVVNGNTLDGLGNGGDGGAVSAAIATRTSFGANATVGKVRNNILGYGTNGARFGIYEVETQTKQAHLANLDNNDFWNPPGTTAITSAAYHYWSGSAATNYSVDDLAMSKVPNLASPGNIGSDPQLDSAGVHIAQTSPCVNAGIASTDAPDHDIDDDGRPKGGVIDIGADEVK